MDKEEDKFEFTEEHFRLYLENRTLHENQSKERKDRHIEGCRIGYKNTRNPIYVWRVLHSIGPWIEGINDPRGDGFDFKYEIPSWCLEYLVNCGHAVEIMDISGDPRNIGEKRLNPQQCIDALPAVLGFSRPGWNAFAESKSLDEIYREGSRVEKLRDAGLSYEEATQQVAAEYGYEDVRNFRRRLSRWKRIYTERDRQEPDET